MKSLDMSNFDDFICKRSVAMVTIDFYKVKVNLKTQVPTQ